MPREAAFAVAHEIALPPEGSTDAVIVLEQGGLRVTAFRVDHAPVSPAVGYRFDWRGRSVVVSGDTRKSASLVANARGADLLVHEALQPDADRARGGHRSPARARAGREARRRHPGLSHDPARGGGGRPRRGREAAGPHPPGAGADRTRSRGACSWTEPASVFQGEITLGEDGMRFALAPAAAP